ncbi:MAG: AAA family ATPase [Candidatus Latescibacteria bacterium]|nr:AAA family ATPase [Candidatus Latescibacterota bacterium]
MLTHLTLRNFKKFDEIRVELGNPVVFIGPNNSGKTSALQALALWEAGLKRWNEKRRDKKTPEKRPGVTINRRELVTLPISDTNLLWRDLHVRDVRRLDGKQVTSNIRIDIIVEGITDDHEWKCGLEFDYANEESFYCRPLRLSDDKNPDRMPVPPEAGRIQIAFLPPMSGLAANETRLDPGAVNVRIGEGRTAEVLRNLCHEIHADRRRWEILTAHIAALFGVNLDPPQYISERGEIQMSYREKGTVLDLSSSGRGLQQTLLLLAYMYANPGAVLLLDEPDAHLEILRQRQIYQLLTEVAAENGNQIIAASHSEVLLNEAAGRDVVIAFVGEPHRINQGSQVLKALKDIGFEHYYLAEQTRWVLYLEGSTDLAILRAFAKKLEHTTAQRVLERPFVHYVGNQPNAALTHFHGLREAVPHLVGVALLDRLEREPHTDPTLRFLMWKRREIENYLCYPEVLEAYAREKATDEAIGPLFGPTEVERRIKAMQTAITQVEAAMHTLGKGSPWEPSTKVSDEFFIPLFENYFEKLHLPNIMAKKNFHELAHFVPAELLGAEIKEKLSTIVKVAALAQSAGDKPA